ncbi:protein fem-1 homolog C-like [Mytilus californianus]|uniref:protein fem-1 homolog C-like n=1 Tax=Mytilus californianus TaxID=6549 RepID=UPI0022480A39|nr:protein fem-1 homolog C-like [Mytilus californianus]
MELYKAVKTGLKELTQANTSCDDALFANWTQLILNGESVNYRNENDFGQGPLHCAANEGHLPAVQFLINHEAKVEAADRREQTPLILASITGHLKVVKYLLCHGGNINRQDKFGCTGLLRASLGGHLSIVQYFISQGADINIKNYKFGRTALYRASTMEHKSIMEYLVDEKGADINASAQMKNVC